MTGSEPPRGLVVDFGGVLTTSLTGSVAAFARDEDVDPEELAAVVREAYAPGAEAGDVAGLETGRLPLEEFERRLAGRLSRRDGRPLEAAGLVGRMFARLEPDAEMAAAVARLRERGVRTALLSNTWGVEAAMREDVLELFDATVLSGEVGVRKPDAAIYRLAVERLGLAAPACVFVDDFEVNVLAAEREGLVGVHHVETADTVRRLEELFG